MKNIIFKNAHNVELGGAINHNRGKIEIVNCEFINNVCENKGGAIACSFKSDIKIIDTKFLKNNSKESGCIFNNNGIIKLINCEFIENSAKTDASTIINMMMGILTIENCTFNRNTSKNTGSILNFGKCAISDTKFEANDVDENGGAINNQIRARLNIKDSKFIENKAGNNGGAIINFSDANLENVLFLRNYSENQAGAISNQMNGIIKIINSTFFNNKTDLTSGAILNWGEINIKTSKFKGNTTKEFGGSILNGETGILKINTTEFIGNKSNYLGGAIVNWSKMHLKDSLFEENTANDGGAIFCVKKAQTNIEKTKFINNSAKDGGAVFNNSHNTKISESIFKNHTTKNVVHNYKSMSLFGCDFKNNKTVHSMINDEDGSLSIYGGEFKDISNKSIIFNIGDLCSINKTKFESEGDMKIYNETYMIINDLKFKADTKTLINNGILDVKNTTDNLIEKNIHNFNKINNFSKKTSNKYDFSYLQERIDKKIKFKKPNLKLKNDISLELYESDYFEGGMEIQVDNLTIDGNHHTIDGKNRSRIFIINAKNVTLKNITLKNGIFRNDYCEHNLGGGAIHVLKNSSILLENVTFIENRSNACGGALLNGGVVKSITSKFINNVSDSYGGAIYNRNKLNANNNEFKENKARIAGAIYNQNRLKIENDIILYNNKSQFSQEIYNANVIVSENKFKDFIFDTTQINGNRNKSKSFTYLEELIEKSDEIKLNQDIVFDYNEDYYLRYVIQISKDLIIDGCGHTVEFNPLDDNSKVIDGNNSSSLFKIIKESTNVTLKNILFKNCYSNRQSIIENKGNLTIENCKFINNIITDKNSLIDNKSLLKIVDCDFANNNSNKRSLIKNSSSLKIINSNFINNNSQAIGSCITNSDELTIKKSAFKSNITKNKAGAIHNESFGCLKLSNVEFEYNSADVDGGVIYNYGKIHISNSNFINNLSKDDGGVINNRTSGEIKIINSKFIKNQSNSNGGVIYNYGNIGIDSCEFKNNGAKYRSSVIEHQKALDNRKNNTLTILNTFFIENTSKDNEEIFTFDKNNLTMVNCRFDNYRI